MKVALFLIVQYCTISDSADLWEMPPLPHTSDSWQMVKMILKMDLTGDLMARVDIEFYINDI